MNNYKLTFTYDDGDQIEINFSAKDDTQAATLADQFVEKLDLTAKPRLVKLSVKFIRTWGN